MRQLIVRAGSACPLFKLAAFGLALAFTFSCSDDKDDDGNPIDSSSPSVGDVSSSSSLARSSSGTSSSGTKPSSSSLQSSSSKNVIVHGKTITDSRDGQTYETVVIGSQTWMAKNLNFQAEGAKCYGEGTRMFSADSIARNCELFGRLYSWETAMSACPEGWHLPYYAEWKQLVDYVGTDYRTKLMTANSDYWNALLTTSGGTDDYGFSGLPGGIYQSRNFETIYSIGYWWTATETLVKSANNFTSLLNFGPTISYNKSDLLSVRCVQGPSGCTSADNTDTHYCLNESGTMKKYGSMTDKGGKTYKTVVIGEQTWMAENLNYEVEYSKCYENKPENCEKYGRLYDWLAATEVCPSGWHLPSSTEWATLREVTLVAVAASASKLKVRGRGDAVDSFGFSALGGGYGSGSSFYNVGSIDRWWTSTDYADKADYWSIYDIFSSEKLAKTNFNSVRCMKD